MTGPDWIILSLCVGLVYQHNEINDHGCWLRMDRDCFTTRDDAEWDASMRAHKALQKLRQREEKLRELATTPKWAKP